MSFPAAILALAVLVLLHETGHFLVARAVGMTPRKFYLGFGPAIVKRVHGGVEYGIAVLPLGGYVKIPGMHRPSAADVRGTIAPDEQRELEPQLDALEAALDRDDEAEARAIVAELEPKLEGNRQLQELDWALAPDAYWRQRAWKKVAVIAAGPLANLLIAFVLFVPFYLQGPVVLTRNVDSVLPNHPAAAAGLHAGDQVVSVAGKRVTANTMPTSIDATHGRPFKLVVERNGHDVTIGPLRAKLDQGAYRIGFIIKGAAGPNESAGYAVGKSAKAIGFLTRETLSAVGGLFVGHGTHQVSSAVGIVRVTAAAYKQSFSDFLGIVAYISLTLALLNLLPVLPLDGGHIVMSLVERVRGRAFSQMAYLRYSAVGLTLFIFLLYLGLRNDFSAGHS
ncbi:MAG TPA: site-2 protease family protein [Gaiellaceae bacterium]